MFVAAYQITQIITILSTRVKLSFENIEYKLTRSFVIRTGKTKFCLQKFSKLKKFLPSVLFLSNE